MKNLLVYFMMILVLGLVACGKGVNTAQQVKYPSEVSESMRSEFNAAESFYTSRDYTSAARAYQRYITSYTYNKLTDESYYKLGKISFINHNYNDAAETFMIITDKSPDPIYRAKAAHMTAYSYYKMNDFVRAESVIKTVKPPLLPVAMRAQDESLAIFISQAQQKQNDYADRAIFMLNDLYEQQPQTLANLNSPDVLSKREVRDLIAAWVGKPMSFAAVSSFVKKYNDGPSKSIFDYKLARAAYEEKDFEKARKLLTAFVSKYPKSIYMSKAAKMLKETGGDASVLSGESYTVAVLAPFSDPQASFAGQVLSGVRCAANDDGICDGASQIQILRADSGSSAESVRTKIDELSFQNVAAIIAILPGSLAAEAVQYAAQKTLPLLIVSQQEGLMRQGSTTFQLGFSPEKQASELADEAAKKGLKNVAIFYPDIPYGEKMKSLFESALRAKGGKVSVSLFYKKDSVDPFAEARRFKNEVDVAMGGKKLDAIFIPDSYRAVNTLANSLVANQLSGMSLMGTNTWNDPGLSSEIGKNFPGSFFVDLYDVSNPSHENKEFVANFTASFGAAPQVLTALGYDAMLMVRDAANADGVAKLRESLADRSAPNLVTGVTGFKLGEEPILQPKVIDVK